MKYNYSKLRGKIKEVFGDESKFALAMGVSTHSISKKLNSKTPFKQAEMIKACELLGIDINDIGKYFFTVEVQNVVRRGA